jgi:hypothetical protein
MPIPYASRRFAGIHRIRANGLIGVVVGSIPTKAAVADSVLTCDGLCEVAMVVPAQGLLSFLRFQEDRDPEPAIHNDMDSEKALTRIFATVPDFSVLLFQERLMHQCGDSPAQSFP